MNGNNEMYDLDYNSYENFDINDSLDYIEKLEQKEHQEFKDFTDYLANNFRITYYDPDGENSSIKKTRSTKRTKTGK